MIIPVRCFTCGKVLADKWKAYTEKILELERDETKVIETTHSSFAKNARGPILDELGITKICCRRHMLGHVDIDI
jgi:DNA-directed RNA polymerase I, II, and III subunit RPABC5